MTGEPTWYDVLGVAPDATSAEIRAAHRAASKAAHPDAGGSAATFQLVQRAYEAIGDPTARAAYDRSLRGAPLRPASVPPTPSRPRAAATEPPAAASPPAPGCITPWMIIGGAIAVVVAILVTIATLSSGSNSPSATASSTAPRAAAGSTTAPAPSANPSGAVTTTLLADLPAGFPSGHVPLPAGARLTDVVVASADGGPVTYTIRASGTGTDPARAALNYGSSLVATGWSATPAADSTGDDAGGSLVEQSFVDPDGSRLQFGVVPGDDGGLDYLIGFSPARR
jgi:hypothetical protein